MFTGPHEWNLDRSEDGGWRRREDNTRNVTEELVLQTIISFHIRFYFTITEKALTHYGVNPRLAKCQSQCLKCESGSSHFQPGEGSSRGSLTMYVFIINMTHREAVDSVVDLVDGDDLLGDLLGQEVGDQQDEGNH